MTNLQKVTESFGQDDDILAPYSFQKGISADCGP